MLDTTPPRSSGLTAEPICLTFRQAKQISSPVFPAAGAAPRAEWKAELGEGSVCAQGRALSREAGLPCSREATGEARWAGQWARSCCGPGPRWGHLSGEGREQAWHKGKSTRTEGSRRNQQLRSRHFSSSQHLWPVILTKQVRKVILPTRLFFP